MNTPKVDGGCDGGTVYKTRAYLNSQTGFLESVVSTEPCKWCRGEGCVPVSFQLRPQPPKPEPKPDQDEPA